MKKAELKYCEWCGGLWLRPARAVEALCHKCREQIEHLPRLWGAKLKRRETLRSEQAGRNGSEMRCRLTERGGRTWAVQQGGQA